LRLHGVPVPSRILGFSAWQAADRPDIRVEPAKLYRIDGRPCSDSPATSHAA
jgi:hypothetical protein